MWIRISLNILLYKIMLAVLLTILSIYISVYNILYYYTFSLHKYVIVLNITLSIYAVLIQPLYIVNYTSLLVVTPYCYFKHESLFTPLLIYLLLY